MKTIPLHPLEQGHFAVVDDESYTMLIQYRWFRSTRGYAVCNLAVGVTGHMHKMVLPFGSTVDHRSRNKLDNRKTNLRFCNHSQNGANQEIRVSNGTGFKGVVWDKARNKYRAQIQVNQRMKNLGRFSTPEEAAAAYDRAAITAWGEFALTNQERNTQRV